MPKIADLKNIVLPLVQPIKSIYVNKKIADEFDFYLKEISFLTQMACEYRVNHLIYINIIQYCIVVGDKEIILEIMYNNKSRLEHLMFHNGSNSVVEMTDGKEQIETLKKVLEFISTN